MPITIQLETAPRRGWNQAWEAEPQPRLGRFRCPLVAFVWGKTSCLLLATFSFSSRSNWSEAKKKPWLYFLMVLLLGRPPYRGQFNPRKSGNFPSTEQASITSTKTRARLKDCLVCWLYKGLIVLGQQPENSGSNLFARSFNKAHGLTRLNQEAALER